MLNNIENEEELNNSEKKFDLVSFFFNLLDYVKWFFIVIVFTQTFFYRALKVQGESMQNTMQPEQNIGVSDLFYFPKQFDIVIVNTFDLLGANIVKRIVAMEGQTVDIKNGKVIVDGVELDEPYVKQGTKTEKFPHSVNPAHLSYPLVVPKGYFFAMGDNRPGSSDSREFGLFKFSQIIGKVLLIWWPWSDFRIF